MKHHLTVAVVVENRGRFLMVRERDYLGKERINQPAGHVEPGESVFDAALRETLEETRWRIQLVHALGVSEFRAPDGALYLRHSFSGRALEECQDAELDKDILEARWMSLDDIRTSADQHRSPMVWNDLQRYLNGNGVPLDAFYFKV